MLIAHCYKLMRLKQKKALKYHMNPEACEQNPKLAKTLHLSCSLDKHILPGLIASDVKMILDSKTCASQVSR